MKMIFIKPGFAWIIASALMMTLFVQCKEEFDPKIETKTTGFLVVEGFINGGQGSTTIHLSRSSNLKDTILKPELNAQLNVEGEDGSIFSLSDNGNGEYGVAQLALSNSLKYRLHL